MPAKKVRANARDVHPSDRRNKGASRTARPIPRLEPVNPPRDRRHTWDFEPGGRDAKCLHCEARTRVELVEGKDGRIAARFRLHGPKRCPKRVWWCPNWYPRFHGTEKPPEPPPPWETTAPSSAPAKPAKGRRGEKF